eukprot:SAG31_NODE_1289_length_8983_cov_9.783543_7_plen_47_part_00
MRCEWSEMGTNGSSDECHTLRGGLCLVRILEPSGQNHNSSEIDLGT